MLVARATLRAAAARTAALSRSRRAAALVSSRRTRCAMAAPAAPLRVTFVTGNKKKLEEVRAHVLPCETRTRAQHASHCFGVLTWRRRCRRRRRCCRQVTAILGTEHAHRFVLDSVSLDLPELQARPSRRHCCTSQPTKPDSEAHMRPPPQGEPEAVVAEKARLAAQHVGCVHAAQPASAAFTRAAAAVPLR
jgi:hypothetical protein